MQEVHVLDSHTEGEPTRVVLSGGPDLGGGTAAAQLAVFRERYDWFRTAVVTEPRGSEVMVGALLTEPADPSCVAGMIFFNNVGFLGMCGHGTIGVVATLAYLGKIGPGEHRLETPVGVVTARLHESRAVSVRNVPSFRLLKDVAVDVPGSGTVMGDVAWGGNWFFLAHAEGTKLIAANAEALTEQTWRIRQALAVQGITGQNGAEIDHVELFAPSPTPGMDNRNFVLCPGKVYDRSPCGTGTSAKMACLYADGKLASGQVWRQESILGGVFEGTITPEGDVLIPTITGRAYMTARATLLFDPADPFREGIGV